MDETHISAERSEAGQDARVPEADVDQGRPGRDSIASGERSPTAVGVTTGSAPSPGRTVTIGPVRSRRTHEALRRSSSRGRSGPLTVAFVGDSSWSGAEVAYAINRRVGIAVVRNRLRRRLKAIMAEMAPSLPTGAYVVRTGPEGPSLGFEELKVAMSQALEKATHRPVGLSPTVSPRRGGDPR
jgi:ribonuclease P protein component